MLPSKSLLYRVKMNGDQVARDANGLPETAGPAMLGDYMLWLGVNLKANGPAVASIVSEATLLAS